MSIIRVRHPRQYTNIPTSTLGDDRLSLSALGLLLRLLRRPDGWEIRMGPLAVECGVGRDKLRGLMRVLTSTRYVIRRRIHDPATGQWDWISEVYDTPQPHSTIDGFSVDGDSVDGRTVDGKHGAIPNKDLSINDSSTTTTTQQRQKKDPCGSGDDQDEPILPKDWAPRDWAPGVVQAVREWLCQAPAHLRQLLADELVGALSADHAINNPMGWLRAIAARWETDGPTPEYALHVAAARVAAADPQHNPDRRARIRELAGAVAHWRSLERPEFEARALAQLRDVAPDHPLLHDN